MSRTFEELARTDTPLGEIVLRRRLEPISHVPVCNANRGKFYESRIWFSSRRLHIEHDEVGDRPTCGLPLLGKGYVLAAGGDSTDGRVSREGPEAANSFEAIICLE